MQDPTPTRPENKRLTFGLLLSLTIHAMLLSLAFNGQGFRHSSFGLPWQENGTNIPDLQVVLLLAPILAVEPLSNMNGETRTDVEPNVLAVFSAPQAKPEEVAKTKAITASTSVLAISALPVQLTNQKNLTVPKPAEDLIAMAVSDKSTWAVPLAPKAPLPETVVATPPLLDVDEAKQQERVETERQELAKQEAAKLDTAQQEASKAEAARIALERKESERKEAVQKEAERSEIAKQTAARQLAERQEASRQETARADATRVENERQETTKKVAAQKLAALQEAARAETLRVEAGRKEIARQETARQVAAQQAAARQEAIRAESARIEAERNELAKQTAARQEAARQEVARAEAARIEGERQEAAKKAAAQQVAAQQDAARAETARADAVRAETARQESAKQAAQQEASRLEAIRIDAARLAALQAEAEKRQEKLRAIGRQLNEESAQRQAAQRQLPSVSSLRRVRLFGRTDPNPELILYAEAWSRKIQLNMTFDMVREAAKQPHTDPMVTVAVRSDGSVESISFVVSSGVPAIDEAIRRIVNSQANYPAFPPGLIKDYDVIEIRRTWHFDMAIRLY